MKSVSIRVHLWFKRNMKKLWLLAFGVALSGCRQAPTPQTAQMPTPIPRPNMDRRLTLLFPGAKIVKLAATESGEFYEAEKGGKIVGRAALIPIQDADKKALQILLVVGPDGKITRIAAGLPGSAGLTPGAAAMNDFLQQFTGKTEVGLTKYQLRKGVGPSLAKTIAEDVRRALIIVKNATKLSQG